MVKMPELPFLPFPTSGVYNPSDYSTPDKPPESVAPIPYSVPHLDELDYPRTTATERVKLLDQEAVERCYDNAMSNELRLQGRHSIIIYIGVDGC